IPSQVPSADPLNMMNPNVGERVTPDVSVMLVLLISHLPPVQDLIVSSLVGVKLPNRSTNDRSFVVIVPSLAASRSFQASQPAFPAVTIASTLASAAEAAFELVLEFAAILSSALAAGGGGDGFSSFAGALIEVSPCQTPCHLSPLRTKTLAPL